MNISINKLNSKELEVVNIIKDELNISINSSNFDLYYTFTNMDNRGFKIEKTNDIVNISYGIIPDMLRALTISLTMKDGSYEETPKANELSYMADCSRNAVLNVESVKKLARLLSLFGYTELCLYIEDTYEVENQPHFGYMRGRYSSDEIKELSSYLNKLGMELVPCIQTLAHLKTIFRWPEYSIIHDTDDILLAEDDKTYKLIDDMMSSISKNFLTNKVHIGMDEAFLVGAGSYFYKNGHKDKKEILLNHLNKVLEISRKYNLKPMMWADMFFRFYFNGEYYVPNKEASEAFLKQNIPSDVKLIYWDYYHEKADDYSKMIKKHKMLSNNVGFAGGAWKWESFAPFNAFSIRVTNEALDRLLGETDYIMVTGWGDNGGDASSFSTMPVLAFYANKVYDSNESVLNASFKTIMHQDIDDFMSLDLANYIGGSKEVKNNSSKYMLFNDPLQGLFDEYVSDKTGDFFKDDAKKLKDIANKNTEWSYMFNSLSSLCDLLSVKASLGIKLKEAYDKKDNKALKDLKDTVIPSCIAKLDKFISDFEKQWHIENKSFGFEVELLRLGGLKERLMFVIRQLDRYLNGDIKSINELEEKRLTGTLKVKEGDKLLFNDFNRIYTANSN